MQDSTEAQWLKTMLRRNTRLELRAMKDGKVLTGIFDNYQALRTAIIGIERLGYDSYITLNPFSKAANNVLSSGQAVSDKDITDIWIIPFDLDPVRDAGTASTDEQCEMALDRADAVWCFLQNRGWCSPVIAFSGNGYHLHYYVDMPNNDRTKETLKKLYLGLQLRFSDDLIKFDVSVRNASRIFRLYGTTNQKSGRKTQVWLNSAYDYECLPTQLIEETAVEVAPPPPQRPTYVEKKNYSDKGISIRGFDVVSAMQRLGLYKRQLDATKHSTTCPWCGEHSSKDDLNKTDTVIWNLNDKGYPGFHCSHDSCAGRGIKDVLNLVGGSYATA